MRLPTTGEQKYPHDLNARIREDMTKAAPAMVASILPAIEAWKLFARSIGTALAAGKDAKRAGLNA